MRVLFWLAFCGFIALSAPAQTRGGAGASSMGGRGGAGVSIGIRPAGGVVQSYGGVRIGSGRVNPVFARGLAGNSRFRRGARAGFGYGIGYPYFGYGVGYGFGIPYIPSFWDFSSYSIGYGPYGAGFAEPNLNLVYNAAPTAVVAPEVVRARPVIREYNERGEEVTAQPAAKTDADTASPIYLIAFKDSTIRAAISYRLEGSTLHYVTVQREDREAPLDSIDRDFSRRLNRERRVPFEL